MKKNYCLLLSLIIFWNFSPAQGENKVGISRLRIELDPVFQADTAVIQFDHGVVGKNLNDISNKSVVAVLQNGTFAFSFTNLYSLRYFSVYIRGVTSSKIMLLSDYIMEPGDNILAVVKIDSAKSRNYRKLFFTMTFTGKGSEKFKCISEMNDTNYHTPGLGRVMTTDFRYVNTMSAKPAAVLRILNRYKSKLSPLCYSVLKFDCQFVQSILDYNGIRLLYKQFFLKMVSGDSLQRLRKFYQKYIAKDRWYNINEITALSSKHYAEYVFAKIKTDIVFTSSFYKTDYRVFFTEIKSKFRSGELKDRLIAEFITEYYREISFDIGEFVDAALELVKSPFYASIIKKYRSLQAGSKAYSFVLPDANGDLIALERFKGKIVFIDFWFSGCAPCVAYYSNVLKVVEERYTNDTSLVFISISLDKNKEQWLKSIETGKYTSMHIVNLYTEGKGWDHAMIKYYNLKGAPQAMLIDQQGFIRNVSVNLKNKEKLIKAIDALKNGEYSK